MQSKVKVSSIYNCSLERVFKIAILTDVAKVYAGFDITPRVNHTTEDEYWGKPGHSKKIFTATSLIHKAGWYSNNKILERIENQYWKLEVSNFQSMMFGFTKFIVQWKTTEFEPNKILIEYTYSLHSTIGILYPLHWLIAKTNWKVHIKRIVANIENLIANKEPYLIY